MDRSHAAFEAYNGVTIHLLGGRTVRVPAFSFAEATRWFRFSATVEQGGAGALSDKDLLEDFPARAGLEAELLEDLRVVQVGARPPRVLEIEEPWGQLRFGRLKLRTAMRLAQLYVTARADAESAKSSWAKLKVLHRFPRTLGLHPESQWEVFDCARKFTEAMYRHIYGLASDFSAHPVLTPLTEVSAKRGRSSSTRDSTT